MSGIKIKKQFKTLLSLMMIFAMVLMNFPSMADATHDYEGTFTVFAGQHNPIGTASVIIDDGRLTIDVLMDPAWPADEYDLYILDCEPTERPNPGHAPYSEGNLDAAGHFTIDPISLNLSVLQPGQCITKYILLHITSGNETAYPGEIVEPAGGAWFGYMPVTLCEPGETYGSLTLIKKVVDSRGQTRTDTSTFTLEVAGPAGYQNSVLIIGNGTAEPFSNLALGDYKVSETPPAGYKLLDIRSGETVLTNDVITLSEANPHRTVTVTNQKVVPDGETYGSLTLIKKVVDSRGQTPTDDTTTFTIEINGQSPVLYQHFVQIIGNNTADTITGLDLGEYKISEIAPEGYTFLSIRSGETDLPNGVITLSEADPHGTVTVTNEKAPEEIPKGAIRIHKFLTPTEAASRKRPSSTCKMSPLNSTTLTKPS
ncbi:MAG: DUF5979 domain-containing protein [Erysipelotrichaceae bacterium]|nr:DUF5979 domain-containing protein [Erysipelotrichaceae bacterium]